MATEDTTTEETPAKAESPPARAFASVSAADAIAQAQAPAAKTRTVTVQPPPYDKARFSIYWADLHGATPGALRIQVNAGREVSGDVPAQDVLSEEEEETLKALLAKAYLAVATKEDE